MDRLEKALEKMEGRGEEAVVLNEREVLSRSESSPELRIEYRYTKKIDVPKEKLVENGLYAVLDDSHLLEEMRILRTLLLEKLEERGGRVVMFTSPNRHEGKTFISSNLAICMAREFDKTSLLVDANLRNPEIANLFCLNDHIEATFADVVTGRAEVKDALYNPGIERLVVMPTRPMTSSAEILGSRRTKELFEELKERYPDRYIIVDSPDVLGCSDPIMLSEVVDAVVLVVESYRTTKSDLARVNEIMPDILGIVINNRNAKC